jgi:A/G-specific adenine glycosylase
MAINLDIVSKLHHKVFSSFEVMEYPWRFIEDPYKIMLSEFMLHRTQANQVVPVYIQMVETYPDLPAFVDEKEEILLNQMSSLGLVWRQKGMILALQKIHTLYGQVPPEYDKLISIDGIGPYIAGAVYCFSTNKPVALVDTNTVRVIGRIFNLRLEGEARRRKEVKEAIDQTTPMNNPRYYYYAMIDHAHQTCLVSNPLCEKCPLVDICSYCQNMQLSSHNPPKTL